jgi:hypothetical protein
MTEKKTMKEVVAELREESVGALLELFQLHVAVGEIGCVLVLPRDTSARAGRANVRLLGSASPKRGLLGISYDF